MFGDSMEVNDYEKINAELAKTYKAVKIESDVDSSSSVTAPAFIPKKIAEQSRSPVQRPQIDLSKTQHGVCASLVSDSLRSVQKFSDVEPSYILLSLRAVLFHC